MGASGSRSDGASPAAAGALMQKAVAPPAEPAATADPAAPNPVPELFAALIVTDPEGQPTTFALDRDVTRVGRDEENDIALPDKKCSRRHFLIEAAGDYFNAVDLGSTNGLRVNGHRVPRRRLRDGDVIQVGEYKLTYRGPTDDSSPDELAESAPAAALPKTEVAVFAAEDFALPESQAPAAPRPAPAAAPGETQVCPQCKVAMPETRRCPECGYRTLRLRAVEYYVDHLMKDSSFLGGLGLWKLTRGKALAQALALENVRWVLQVRCPNCGQPHRAMNEWRTRCIPCSACGQEIALPVEEPPNLR